MTTYKLGNNWRISLSDGMKQRQEGDQLVFWRPGESVFLVRYAYSGDKGREIMLANLRARAKAKQLDIIEEAEGQLIRFGYIEVEEIRPGHQRLALHAFSMAEYDCLQTSFYLDRGDQLKQALLAWKSVEQVII